MINDLRLVKGRNHEINELKKYLQTEASSTNGPDSKREFDQMVLSG